MEGAFATSRRAVPLARSRNAKINREYDFVHMLSRISKDPAANAGTAH
jgi:hypothetical protein